MLAGTLRRTLGAETALSHMLHNGRVHALAHRTALLESLVMMLCDPSGEIVEWRDCIIPPKGPKGLFLNRLASVRLHFVKDVCGHVCRLIRTHPGCWATRKS